MSSGTGDEMGASVSDYFKKIQSRRDTWIWIIDTTDEEEQCMMNKAIDLNKKLKTINLGPLPVLNNCFSRKRLVRTVLIFTESSDQLSRATDRVPGLPASPGYVQ